jgi:hypothetical protein
MVGAIFLCCRLQPGPRELDGNLGGKGPEAVIGSV